MKNVGTLIVSLDFELFWGMQDCTTLDAYRENILGGRKAIEKMLNLFERHGIRATWAAVGFLFAENEQELKTCMPAEAFWPSYENEALSAYRYLQKTKAVRKEPECFFAADVIDRIAQSEGQEIASHTFSHYYCRENGQTLEQFREDLLAAKAIARRKGYELTSIIFPRNQCREDYIPVLKELGFNAYRDEENDWIHEKVAFRPLMRLLRLADVYLPLTGQGGYSPKDDAGIVNLVGSRMYKPYMKALGFMEGLKIHRIKRQMLHAAKKGQTFHLWWHPHNVGTRTQLHMDQLEEIFAYYDVLKEKYGMRSMNMKEAAAYAQR